MKKPDRRAAANAVALADVCTALESIAPLGLAQSWDNVGLLAGDPSEAVQHVLLCIDLTTAVAQEAAARRTDLILAYHPPIFRPITSIRADAPGAESVVYRCIRNGMAVYAVHTALDAADGGTNDTLASLCGVEQTAPIEYVPQPGVEEYKLVVTVPPEQVDPVAEAMFDAGAGQIGDYSRCSFRAAGTGSFLGGASTDPTVGIRGRMEYIEEIRLEMIVSAPALPAVVGAMVKAHPYEEPAFDIYPLRARPVRGIGRVGNLREPVLLSKLAEKLRRATEANCVQIVGPSDRQIDRIVAIAGAAGQLPFRIPLRSSDAIITGEIRHHDAMTIERIGCTAIALGHWASERCVLNNLAARLKTAVPGVQVQISEADRDPFAPI